MLFYVFENFLNQGSKTLDKLLLCLLGVVHITILTCQRSKNNAVIRMQAVDTEQLLRKGKGGLT